MNYRSVVAFGRARALSEDNDKLDAFRSLLEHLVPGRWDDCRQPDRKEIAATTVLSMPLGEASVKVRSGPPKDAQRDADAPYWAGVIPLELAAAAPIADAAPGEEKPPPGYARDYSRRGPAM